MFGYSSGVAASGAVAEAGEASNFLSANEDTSAVTAAHESYPVSSNSVPANDAVKGYSYFPSTEDYNQLLAEYYELEDKREKLLQKLHQYGNWSYQAEPSGSDPGVQQWQGAHPSQEYPIPADQISHSVDACACCPYFCQTFVAPCPASSCSFGGKCGDQNLCNDDPSLVPRDSIPLKDCEVTRTAIEAARKAISSLKIEGSSICEGKENKKEGDMVVTTSSETDLAEVLNAWYSAGFYTGKYLVEKCIREKRQS
ncbi:hypothetical protein CDL15_Pgr003663 [Punica granatum]|uniref:Survival motor neuron Tudor domain-containing protein n=1 Tax=Punica granatum TaxID=22663 RepID=A0A218XUP5_PUNGR|nr:hypothetical protein CDL15_Pgr003663 [Punica granatum]